MTRRLSLRRQLLLGILVPVVAIVSINTVSLYRQALRAANTAYDRTLLASAKSIGEELQVTGGGDQAKLSAAVSYAALEAFEADNRSRIFYKVTGFAGEMVSGFEDLPAWRGAIPTQGPYAALVDFYDDQYGGEPVRVAVLLQPVAGVEGQGMATIQVAETLELRHTLAQQILVATLWRQIALVAVIAVVVVLVVQRATRPVRRLSGQLSARSESDLSPIAAPDAPRELLPLVDATNQVMARLQRLLEHQKRFVRDASHQLRTPLAVLKTQVQSAQHGDLPAEQALQEIGATVERATRLANQMLSLAKVEQVQAQGPLVALDLSDVVSQVALDTAPLIAAKGLDFELQSAPIDVLGHDWMLRELTRNLLSNAVRETPPGGRLLVVVGDDNGTPMLRVCDSGPGLRPGSVEHLFEPFHTGHPTEGSGLGLAICRSICDALGARMKLVNRQPCGLDALVHFRAPA
ncbi:sensor histidine kinase [Piscinibacter sp.]|uniref:sensor histidine kinase n=1 Tax=Piscinibacter sp. TaxID=1903157 RepID=UPI002BB51F82|nr:sensor histidine kinase N-terminal domain-containing protein [Albitalea sp.]HUG23160.1 sensor histidine kinase N-terminal domain-containing protein [Albitalea sp.]